MTTLRMSAVILLSTVACAPRKPDPLVILKATAQQYSELRSYQFAAQVTMTPADGSNSKVTDTVAAGTADGKSRLEQGAGAQRTISVSDGKTDWAYVPSTNEYMEAPSGALHVSKMSRDLAGIHAGIDVRLEKATWLRTEEVPLDGRPQLCDVIEVRSKPGRPAVNSPENRQSYAEWTDVPTTYWIDRQKHRVLRQVAVSAKGTRMETVVTFARINEELPETLFVSPVPAGATRADAHSILESRHARATHPGKDPADRPRVLGVEDAPERDRNGRVQ